MGKHSKKAKQPRAVEQVLDESDDEEIPEDEAFNSEDEAKYGDFFRELADRQAGSEDEESSGDEDEDESSSSSASEDDEEGDGGQYMLDLLEKIDDGKKDSSDDKKKTTGLLSHVKESQFASSVVPKAGLTLDTLMKGLEDTKGFGVVQKKMRKVAEGKATSAPVARVVSDRAQRQVHYEHQTKEVSQWLGVVQENRQAETLDFRPKGRVEVTRDVMVENFVPTTDFEKQIHDALQQAGQQDEEEILKREEAALQDDLGANEITMEEYKQRRGQLAKMRALMFYHEQKRHHMNKIKSKKYRRIRKKQRERQKEADLEAQAEENPDILRELEEKEEVERMKERASLAHKNTSKWAKRVLKRGKNVDIETRRALSAQLKRGDDLRKKMRSTRESDDESDGSEDLVDTARKVLAETEDDADESVQGKGLFKLSFMQKGIERQKQKAREEARQLLRELQASDDLERDSSAGSDEDEPPKKKVQVASKEEMTKVLESNALVASSLKFGNSNSLAVSGSIEIDVALEDKNDDDQKGGAKQSVHDTTFDTSEATLDEMTSKKTAAGTISKGKDKGDLNQKAKKSSSAEPKRTLNESSDANPWLAATGEEGSTKAPSPSRQKITANRTGMVDVERAVDLLDTTELLEKAVSKELTSGDGDKKVTMLTQEELVRRAFMTAGDEEADEEFAREKQAVEEEEDAVVRKRKKEKDMSAVAGWGSWAGDGAPPPKPPSKFPKRLHPPEKKPKRKREDAKKPNVIISEKRVKKMADNFMISEVPYPFSSKEEYEKSMKGGVGREWNVTSSFKDMTRPEIISRSGQLIRPISKKLKQRRAPAKF